jgi:hypothetical protein
MAPCTLYKKRKRMTSKTREEKSQSKLYGCTQKQRP